MSKARIQKVLAHLGVGSRREIEQWIQSGRITLNQNPAQLGDLIDTHDTVAVDGRVINLEPSRAIPTRLIRFHKPEGLMCTRHDPEGRPTVFSYLPALEQGRWIMIGRLDINTSGLLLFTTDGMLAHRLMHPSTMIEREYDVRVFGIVTPDILNYLQTGVMLEDGLARFSSIQPKKGTGMNRWFTCTLAEGRYREVRRLWASQELQVSQLIRQRYGMFTLDQLPSQQWAEVPLHQLHLLQKSLGSVDKAKKNPN